MYLILLLTEAVLLVSIPVCLGSFIFVWKDWKREKEASNSSNRIGSRTAPSDEGLCAGEEKGNYPFDAPEE
jgi:hypothetical protein